jgi:hypothetical protein
MIFGLTMLAFNFERILEIFIVKFCLFFLPNYMKILVLKNLNAHKVKNSLTGVIQSVTIASIVFLITMLHLEILQFQSYKQLSKAPIVSQLNFIVGEE